MKNLVRNIVIATIAIGTFFLVAVGCPTVAEEEKLFFYTSTNDPDGNVVVVMEAGNGAVEQIDTYPTGGVGDADDGDFDGQSAMRVVDDYLLVVNAGDANGEAGIKDGNGSVSVFKISSEGGGVGTD